MPVSVVYKTQLKQALLVLTNNKILVIYAVIYAVKVNDTVLTSSQTADVIVYTSTTV